MTLEQRAYLQGSEGLVQAGTGCPEYRAARSLGHWGFVRGHPALSGGVGPAAFWKPPKAERSEGREGGKMMPLQVERACSGHRLRTNRGAQRHHDSWPLGVGPFAAGCGSEMSLVSDRPVCLDQGVSGIGLGVLTCAATSDSWANSAGGDPARCLCGPCFRCFGNLPPDPQANMTW